MLSLFHVFIILHFCIFAFLHFGGSYCKIQQTPIKDCELTKFWRRKMAKYEKELRQPEIESRANAWKAFMLPLHHWRCKLAILMLFHKNIASFIYTYYSICTYNCKDYPQTCNSNNHSYFYLIEENRYSMYYFCILNTLELK